MIKSNMNLNKLGLFLAATFLFSMSTTAQVDRSKTPEPGTPPEVRLGDHKTFMLENGMRVIVVRDAKVPMVSMQLKFDIDPILQGEIAGYIDLVGELLASGTSRKTKEQIDKLVDGTGGTLHTSNDGLYISSLKKNFQPLLELAYEIIAAATFPPNEFEKAKKRAMSAIQSRNDDPDAIADEVGKVLTFNKGFPYGEIVTEATLSNVGRKHVYAYYERFFRPENGYLVFVGDVDEDQARSWSERFFNSWEGHEYSSTTNERGEEVVDGLGPIKKITKKPRPRKVRRIAVVDRPGAAQSVIRVVFPVDLQPGSEDAMSASVMSSILGGGVFNARLMQNLREDKAFTYGARSSLRSDKHIGRFMAATSVRTQVTDSAVTELMYEIEHMALKPPTDEEMEIAKNFLAGSFARSLESAKTRAQYVLKTYLNELPEDHYATYLQRLDKVTAKDVVNAAKKYLYPDQAVILVVGDKSEVANKLVPLSFERKVVQYDENGEVYRDTPSAAPAGVTAGKVIDNYLQALGGKSKLMAIDDVSKIMTASVGGMTFSLNTWQKAPDKYAMEMKMGPQVMERVAYNGTKGMRFDAENIANEIDPDVEEIRREAQMFPELHYDLQKKNVRLVLSGVSKVNGKDAYKLMVFTENGSQIIDYFDVKSGLKVRNSQHQYTPQGNIEVVTDYKDHREVEGVQFPHLIQQKSVMNLSFIVEDIKVNKGIDPARFDVP